MDAEKIDRSHFVELASTVINWRKVLFVMLEGQSCVVVFDGGTKLFFSGGEAAEVWRLFAVRDDWRK